MSTLKSPRVTVDNVLAQARALVKSAGIGSIPADPSKSSVGIPPADGTSPNLPSDSKPQNTDAAPATVVPMPETNPSKSGEGSVPAVEDGTKKEEMISPSTTTDALLKSAAAVRELLGLPAQTQVAAAAAPAPSQGDTAKTASDNDKIELTEAYHAKIASIMLGSEHGRAVVAAELDRVISHQEALELIKQASTMQQHYEQLGAANLEQQQAMHAHMNQLEMEKIALAREYEALQPEERTLLDTIQGTIKLASARYDAIPNGSLFQDWLVKGAGDMGAMMGDPAMMAAMQGGGAPPEMPAGPEGGEGGGLEELIMMLEQLVASGEVTEEEAMQVAQILMQEAEGASPSGEIQKAASAALTELAVNNDELIKAASSI